MVWSLTSTHVNPVLLLLLHFLLTEHMLFLLQKSHEIIYIGRDRPGQLHSLYQARCRLY